MLLNNGIANCAPSSVLVVDDEPSMRCLLSSSYIDQGYRVYEAASENEAIDLCKKIDPDLLVTDVRMPDGDGRTLVEKIRSNKSLDPIIFCISSFRDMSPTEVFTRGIDQFFQKPVDLETLLSASKHFLSHRRKRRMRGASLPNAAQESIETLLKNLKNYLVITDHQGIVLECSDSFRVLRRENTIGKPFSGAISEEDQMDFARKLWPLIVAGDTDTAHINLKLKSNKTVLAEFAWTQGTWFGNNAFFGVGHIHKSLEIPEADIQFEANPQMLAIQARMEMIQNAASEARIQLHAIAGYASMLEPSSSGARERRFVQSILKSVSTTQNHTTDILDLVQS